MSGASCGRLLVVSPHLDDAVFSAGQLLAARRGSIVVTVFAGVPAGDAALLRTGWDERCGFDSAAQAMHARREEDRLALEPLSAHPRWLDFLDAQYAPSPSPDEVARGIDAVLRECAAIDTVLMPFGLFHSDHELVHDACLRLYRHAARRCTWIAYEDALYRRKTGLLQHRLGALAACGVQATPWFPAVGSTALKAGSVQSYASQLRAFGAHGCDDLAAPERYWRLEP